MIYKTDEEKMEVALTEAKKALEIDEIPVGAALFDEEHNLIFSAHNQRELKQNPVAHAEILVLQNSAEILGCLLYTSPSPRDLSTSRMPSSA